MSRICCPACTHESPDNRLDLPFFLAYSHQMASAGSLFPMASRSLGHHGPSDRGVAGCRAVYYGFSLGRPYLPGSSGNSPSSHGGTRWWDRPSPPTSWTPTLRIDLPAGCAPSRTRTWICQLPWRLASNRKPGGGGRGPAGPKEKSPSLVTLLGCMVRWRKVPKLM